MLDDITQSAVDRMPDVPEQFIPGLDPAIASMGKKNQETKVAAQEKEAAKILETIDDDFVLSAWGYTDELKLTKGNDVQRFRLKIKSVGVQDVIERTEKTAPRPPSSVKGYKKGSAEALAVGSQIGVIVREVDYSDPAYMEKMDAHNRRSGQIILLAGLAYDWKDPKDSGRLILKGANVEATNDIIDEEACLLRLRRMGMTGAHYALVLKNIRGLTEDEEVREGRE